MTFVSITRAFLASVALLPLAMIAGPADAQPGRWPVKPVQLIVPFPAGGSADVVARQIAAQLSTEFGQQFVVDNRSGAAGNIGTDAVAKAAPDGYVLGLSTSGPLANNKSLYKNMPFDAQKDLTPIALVGEIPLVIAVNPMVKANNLQEFVALSKTQPQGLTVGHPGNGTIGHLAIEYFKSQTGAATQSVPYRGDSPAITDVMGGSIQAISAPVTSMIPNIKGGKLRALAVTSDKRFPGLPDVPTAKEQGVDVEATVWFAVIGPAGVPKDIVDRINQSVNRYTNSPDGRAKLAQFALIPANDKPEQLSRLMDAEAAKWKAVVEAAKITLE